MIAQAWHQCKCKVHHMRSARPRVEAEQGGVVWRAAARRPCPSACACQNDAFWQAQVSRFPMSGRSCSALPVGVSVALSLVVRPLYRGLCSSSTLQNRRLVLADAGDRISHLPQVVPVKRPFHPAMRGTRPSLCGISLARQAACRISRWRVDEERLGSRPARGRQGARGTARESPAPGGGYRPKGGPSPQGGPPARQCGRAAPGTPISSMARVWVPWECLRGTLSLAGPLVTHTARPSACLSGWGVVP